ncbi:hypothetical protein NHX12_004441 [Muraenolepis orangiensis]|uniref:Propionate--CoA ligase n=1 Tax=Muraenolepis orangiensis TaxID=630683 RepID=A0A9Q0IFK3_9TELE|nr:hypothetical protein NHX12_004441 [Muraenolepis orangiensis]
MVIPTSHYSEDNMYHPPLELQKDAHVPDFNTYLALYRKSVENPEEFWKEVADDFFWKKPAVGPMLRFNFDVTKGDIFIKFMEGAKTNICYNVLDRNVREKNLGEKVAYFWEGNSPDQRMVITYGQMLAQVCRCANVLKKMGVKKGDRVAIYLPMIPELVYTMLACARIGAVHSIVFAGFSSESLCERIVDAQSSVLVTADGVYRGEKLINLKQIADEALEKCRERSSASVTKCLVVRHHGLRTQSAEARDGLQTSWDSACDVRWDEAMRDASEECEPEWLDAEDPLFILYTSGSTGRPKCVFDHRHDDVYWCTADIGWITGHSYITYGPLANGATSVLVIEKYKVTKFYTAPTALRLLMKYGPEPVKKYDLSSLRILGTVGEPINAEAWHWYYEVVGQSRCPVVDTFWQTETGGHVLTPLPAATPLKPGSATFPFFGVEPAILNEHGEELEGEAEGYLVFRRPWPGIMRTVYQNHERFENIYFNKFPGFYVTGDGCRRDKDGYYWITGRIDDMLNVSGECLHCFVSLKDHLEFNRTLEDDLKKLVREKIGPIATPDYIQSVPSLPKTRSGKIMRRILRKIACNESDLGDLSTLADPKVVELLLSQRSQAAA